MTEQEILLGMHLAEAAAAGAVLFGLGLLQRGAFCEKQILGAYRELSGLLREKQKDSSLYRQLNLWLRKKGASYHYGNWVNPTSFAALSLILAVAAGAVCSTLGRLYGPVAAMLAGSMPALLLVLMNKQDMERQLPELKLIYHALEIQIKAGVYVTDALAECYGSVQEKRLKTALLEMTGDIVMKADILNSLERFQSKFDNPYVDSLCITILQALESGQAVELLRDIGEQVKDMEETVLARKKASLDRAITFCQLGVLTVVLGLALYICVNYMFQSAVIF